MPQLRALAQRICAKNAAQGTMNVTKAARTTRNLRALIEAST
jgi:hypothetical protein